MHPTNLPNPIIFPASGYLGNSHNMTVAWLRELLAEFPDDAVVLIYDPENDLHTDCVTVKAGCVDPDDLYGDIEESEVGMTSNVVVLVPQS